MGGELAGAIGADAVLVRAAPFRRCLGKRIAERSSICAAAGAGAAGRADPGRPDGGLDADRRRSSHRRMRSMRPSRSASQCAAVVERYGRAVADAHQRLPKAARMAPRDRVIGQPPRRSWAVRERQTEPHSDNRDVRHNQGEGAGQSAGRSVARHRSVRAGRPARSRRGQ